MALTEPAAIPAGSPVRGRGILAMAAPAPDGWERGGIQSSTACPTPIIRDKCVTLVPGDAPTRPTAAEFPAFMIEQGVDCSTLSGGDREAEAREALSQSTDYALGLTLYNGQANDGAASLSDADDIGAFADVVAALAALECAAADAGKGSEWVIHATPGAAAYLASQNLIDGLGRTPSGASVIVSAGYLCDEDEHRLWATGRVWAAAGVIDTYQAVNRVTNNREAWAVRSAIVGFNTCINLTATFPVAAASPEGV